jgi:hypothetical protein
MEKKVRVVARGGAETSEPPRPRRRDPGTAQPEQPTRPPEQPIQPPAIPDRDTPREHPSRLPQDTTSSAGHGG